MEDAAAHKQYYHHHKNRQDYEHQRDVVGRNSHQAWRQKNGHVIQQRAMESDAPVDNNIGDPYLLGRLDNIIGHFRKDIQEGIPCKKDGNCSLYRELLSGPGPHFGMYGSFLPVTLRPPRTELNNPVSTQNCRVHESVIVGAVEKLPISKNASIPGKDISFSGINSSTQEIGTHSFASTKNTLDKRQMTSTEVEDHQDYCPKSTLRYMLSFNTRPLSPMPKRDANLFSQKNGFSMGESSNSIDFECGGNNIQVHIPKKKLTSPTSESKSKPDLELQGGTAKKLKKDADTKRTSKESGLMMSRASQNLPNELHQEKSEMQGACGMNTHICKDKDLITEELKGSGYTQDFRTCSLKGHQQAGATQHLDMSCKPENGNTTGYSKKISINQGRSQMKEVRKENSQQGFVSEIKKKNKPFKKVMKSGLSDDDRNEALKNKLLGQAVTNEKVVTDTDHGMDNGWDNVKTHNTSKKALKEKNNEVIRDQFEKSGKETQVKDFALGRTVNNEKTKISNKEFYISGVKRKFAQMDLKKETNILNSSVSIKKNADTKRASKESGLPNELHQEQYEMQGTCGMNTYIHKERDLITDELKGSGYTQDVRACSLKGHKQAGATQHLDMSCKPENGSLTENSKKISINQGQGQMKEVRKETSQQRFVSGLKKMNKPFKKVMKSGLLDDDRNEACKNKHVGQAVAKEKVVTDTRHRMDNGWNNFKTHNTSKNELKEKNNEITRDKFEISGKETELKDFSLGNNVNNEPTNTKINTKEFHVSGVKCKFGKMDIKNKTNVLNSSANIKKARRIEKEKKRDVTEDAGTSNAYVSNVVNAQSLVDLRTQKTSIAEPVPSLIFENWVECDRCKQWRLLPLRVDPPSANENWFCSMQNWLPPEMSNCDIPAEETELAFRKLYGVSQSHVQTDQTPANVQLPDPVVSKHLRIVKATSQGLEEDILQSPSKTGHIKKGVVQRSRPCVSVKGNLSRSLVENDEQYHVKMAKDSRAFSECENERKVNGAIKQEIPAKEKMKPKQISNVAKTLKVKRKGGEEFKGYKTANTFGVEENLVHGAKAVDLLPLKSARTGGLKDSIYVKLAKQTEQYSLPLSANLKKMPKDNCTQSTKYELNDGALADDNKFRDQHRAIKKRKLKECKQSNSIQHGLLETECMEGVEPRREERQVEMQRKKNLKAEEIEPHASKGAKVEMRQQAMNAAKKSELVIDEMDNQFRQQSGEHDVPNASGETEALKRDSACLAPFVSTTSSSSRLSFYTKIFGSVPDVGGSSVESSVSSLTARNLKAQMSSARSKSSLKDDCRPCEGQVVYSENIDASSGESSRIPGELGTHGKGNLCLELQAPILNGLVGNDLDLATVAWGKEHWLHSAKAAFQQGRDLAEKADRIKNKKGAESDFIGLYFHASLKFLHSASILEHSAADSARNRVKESLALYEYSARLSEECAKTYEGNKKWAAATLAYYCGGSAHMCFVKAKTATINRDRHELQSAVQLISSGESPCSSVSDVDNLNNHALIHGNLSVNPDKGVGSLHASRNYLIDQQHFPHYNHLLQYVGNMAVGMENLSKAQVAFHAFKRSCYEENEIDAVRRAIDFSCHNIDGLLLMVHLAMDAIDH